MQNTWTTETELSLSCKETKACKEYGQNEHQPTVKHFSNLSRISAGTQNTKFHLGTQYKLQYNKAKIPPYYSHAYFKYFLPQ